jgi:large subunit ribosomal protein L5
MAATETAPPARLKVRYLEEIRPALISRFGYSSLMQTPKVEKITVNMGVGMARQDNKMLKAATDQLAQIAGQQPSIRRARKSIAAFKLREGMPVGVAVTLRGERGYEFLDRLVSIAIPRIRDFRGLNPRSFDGRGNYSMGVKEQIIFPEIDYDAIDQVRGMDITITTSAQTDLEAYALLAALGMPFTSQGRPKGYDPEGDAAGEQAHIEAEEKAAASAAAKAAAPLPDNAPKAEKMKAAAAAAAAEREAELDAAEQPESEEPAAEEVPAAEEAPAAEAPPEEATAEESAAEEPTAEEPTAEEPTAEESTAEEPTADEPTAEESTAEEPTAEEPAAEEPQAETAEAPEAAAEQDQPPTEAQNTEKESTD